MRACADTNFLVPLYLPAGPVERAQQILKEAKTIGMRPLPVTPLLHMEVVNAFQLHVYFARTQGQWRVTPETAASASAGFNEDLERSSLFRPVTVGSDAQRRVVEELSLRHTAKHGFRTYDLVHVASAHLLRCDHFWSFDAKARELAQLEGLCLNDL